MRGFFGEVFLIMVITDSKQNEAKDNNTNQQRYLCVSRILFCNRVIIENKPEKMCWR